jgi:hypothetical protein
VADNETPAHDETPRQTGADLYPDDLVAQGLHDRIRSSEALLNGLKYDVGHRVAQAAEGTGEMPSAQELLAMNKLEQQLENQKTHLRLRVATRKRREA